MDELFLSVAELAERTSLSLRTWRAFIKEGDVPHFRVGGRVLVKWSEAVEWLERFRAKPKPAVALPATEQAREMLATMQNKEPLWHKPRKPRAGAVGRGRVQL